MSKKFVDYYTLLDVKRESTKEQIKEAFMTQALKWHPEKAENDEDKKLHTKIYADLQQAYKVLSNDETRKMYKDSQQNTIDDFRTQKRDVGYQKSDKYSSKTGTGIKFDSSVFSDAFNNTRNKEDLQALNQFHNSINNDVVTDQDIQSLIKQRETERDLLESNTVSLYNNEKFNNNTFNQAFDFQKAQQASTSLQEINNVQGMFSSGGLMEDDGMAGLGMSNGMDFLSNQSMDNIVNGVGFNPSSGFNMEQFNNTDIPYGSEPILSSNDIADRMLAVQEDRVRLANIDRKQFSTEASEIEKMYSGLFVPRDVEGLDAPAKLSVKPEAGDEGETEEKQTNIPKTIALKKIN
uniref:J domain-containing protein n=1 Tax=viral metagenome TaxID=1070528 RepID=A0A6C0J670_9ZZZZ